jgi:hypothetical protein
MRAGVAEGSRARGRGRRVRLVDAGKEEAAPWPEARRGKDGSEDLRVTGRQSTVRRRNMMQGRKGRCPVGAVTHHEGDGVVAGDGGKPRRPESKKKAARDREGNGDFLLDWVHPASITCTRLKSLTGRSERWPQIVEGWPETAGAWRGRCGGSRCSRRRGKEGW